MYKAVEGKCCVTKPPCLTGRLSSLLLHPCKSYLPHLTAWVQHSIFATAKETTKAALDG